MPCGLCTVGTLVVCALRVVAGTGPVPDGAGVPDEPGFALGVVVDGAVAVLLGEDVTLDVTADVTLDVTVGVTLGVTLDDPAISAGATLTGTSIFPGGNEIVESGIAWLAPIGILANCMTIFPGPDVVVVSVLVAGAVLVLGGGAAPPPATETTASVSRVVGDGFTVTNELGSQPCHPVPVNCWLASPCGSASGLPESQRTRGTPRLSTSTAVPVCSTDWNAVASPFWKP